jgi:hypothetical protein
MGMLKLPCTPTVVVILELQQSWSCEEVLDTCWLIIQRKAFIERKPLTLPCHVCDNLQAFTMYGVQKLLEQISSTWLWSSVCISQAPQERMMRKINVSAVSWTREVENNPSWVSFNRSQLVNECLNIVSIPRRCIGMYPVSNSPPSAHLEEYKGGSCWMSAMFALNIIRTTRFS